MGSACPNAKFALLGDYANSRGAADMGLLPDLLPGYLPVETPGAFGEEYGATAADCRGWTCWRCSMPRAAASLRRCMWWDRIRLRGTEWTRRRCKDTFVVVQDMFLTETAALADVVLPAANLYEKSGSVTNTYGDLQLVKKAADRAGVRTDFELIVRMADKMGVNSEDAGSVWQGRAGGHGTDAAERRSGEADRHAVWLTANNLEPKLSPFDPFAILDEIQRLVPGYDVFAAAAAGGQRSAPRGGGWCR